MVASLRSPRWPRARALLAVALAACAHDPTGVVLPPGTHTGYYVAATGTPGGTGADSAPWDLGTALAGARGRIQPGDTVWMRQGRYRGNFETALTGTAGNHIIFRWEYQSA